MSRRWLTSALLALALGVASMGCGDEFSCSKDYDCAATKVCNKTTGQCEPFECETADDCTAPGATCKDNVCSGG